MRTVTIDTIIKVLNEIATVVFLVVKKPKTPNVIEITVIEFIRMLCVIKYD